jgi:RNA-binding proteins (RRM domain)
MAKRLFVGGVPYSVSDQQLQDLFATVGPVTSCRIIKDKFTGRSKGFGFVEYDNDDDAVKAVEKLNGYDLDGRKITVNEARPMEDRGPARPGMN